MEYNLHCGSGHVDHAQVILPRSGLITSVSVKWGDVLNCERWMRLMDDIRRDGVRSGRRKSVREAPPHTSLLIPLSTVASPTPVCFLPPFRLSACSPFYRPCYIAQSAVP